MVQSRSYALSREEIIRALTAYTGITTTDGAVTNDSLIDAVLVGATDWITNKTILIDSGASEHQDRGAAAFNPVNGEITFNAACTNRILAGTIYRILNISSAALTALILARCTGTPDDGTYSLPNDAVEHDVTPLIFAAAIQQIDIELDMSNLTQNNTIREYVQTDGVNPQQISARVFPGSFAPGTKVVPLSFKQKDSEYKITLQAAIAEGAPRDIYYRYLTQPVG